MAIVHSSRVDFQPEREGIQMNFFSLGKGPANGSAGQALQKFKSAMTWPKSRVTGATSSTALSAQRAVNAARVSDDWIKIRTDVPSNSTWMSSAGELGRIVSYSLLSTVGSSRENAGLHQIPFSGAARCPGIQTDRKPGMWALP
jgi:hypothetical protein